MEKEKCGESYNFLDGLAHVISEAHKAFENNQKVIATLGEENNFVAIAKSGQRLLAIAGDNSLTEYTYPMTASQFLSLFPGHPLLPAGWTLDIVKCDHFEEEDDAIIACGCNPGYAPFNEANAGGDN